MSESSTVYRDDSAYDEDSWVYYDGYGEVELDAYFVGAASDGCTDEAFDACEPDDSAY